MAKYLRYVRSAYKPLLNRVSIQALRLNISAPNGESVSGGADQADQAYKAEQKRIKQI
ncbi:predicted protein [Arabidopsis lyrata subsp. lyrata]|uniref:Predicted protein n=1 Tax=Arabidopsis lyrata subsp. lyrata TaxID=81972 RepID=D7KH59_ARALL|nr:predicted protein [Arabidopsis lyrata subsp. lyrata]